MLDRADAQLVTPTATLTPSRLLERCVLAATDLVMVNLAFYVAWYARYRLGLFVALDPGNYVEHDVYLPLQLGLSIVFVISIAVRGLYRLPRAASALEDMSTIF